MIGIAAVFGAISIFAADHWVKSAANARIDPIEVSVPVPDEPKLEFGTIVVAAAPLRFGMELDRAQLSEIPWPQDNLPVGAFGSVDELLADGSRVVLSPMETSEPVLLAKLSGANGRATLSNLLAPGMRAVAIKTDEIAGVGGFIMPGDRVDIVLTRDAGAIQEVSDNAAGAAGSTITTEVVVENAKVLTVGQGADQRQTSPQVVNSVTVEVSVDGATKVALARNVGALSRRRSVRAISSICQRISPCEYKRNWQFSSASPALLRAAWPTRPDAQTALRMAPAIRWPRIRSCRWSIPGRTASKTRISWCRPRAMRRQRALPMRPTQSNRRL